MIMCDPVHEFNALRDQAPEVKSAIKIEETGDITRPVINLIKRIEAEPYIIREIQTEHPCTGGCILHCSK